MRRRIALLLPAILLVVSCNSSREISAEERSAIELALRTYASQMALAYEAGDASRVAEVATEREQQRLSISISELEAEGRGLRPRLERLVVEEIERAGNLSVTAATTEVWDLRVVALGTEQLVTEALAQENRLYYSLVQERGRWLVLSRLLRSSSADT